AGRELEFDIERMTDVLLGIRVHVVEQRLGVSEPSLYCYSRLNMNRDGPAMMDQVAAVERVMQRWLDPTTLRDSACENGIIARLGDFPQILPKSPAIRRARTEQLGGVPCAATVGADLDPRYRLFAGPGHAKQAIGADT